MFKKIISLFLVVILTSCNSLLTTPTITLSEVMETAQVIVKTEIVGTLTAMPTNTPVPSASPLPPTQTSIPVPQNSSIPISGTPTIVNMENGLTWTECVQPNLDYANSAPDMEFVTPCLHMERPYWNDNDNKISGERISGNNGSDLRQVIGNDVFLVKHDGVNGCCDYEFLKNGNLLLETSAPFISFDPNRNLWNIGGRSVWELITDPPTIIVDGIDFNEKYHLEGIFIPYVINDRLIYIAKRDGKYHIEYDEKVIGPEFDEIYIKYCCATTKVFYGGGQYWFWGKRDGTYYVVAIH